MNKKQNRKLHYLTNGFAKRNEFKRVDFVGDENNIVGLGDAGRNIINYIKQKVEKENIELQNTTLNSYDFLMPTFTEVPRNLITAYVVNEISESKGNQSFFAQYYKRDKNIICVGLGGFEGTVTTELVATQLIYSKLPLKVIASLPFSFETGRDYEYSLLLINRLKKYIDVEVIDPDVVLKDKGHLPFKDALEMLNEEFHRLAMSEKK